MQVVNRVNVRFYELLQLESERPFDHYSFWSVAQSQLVPKGTLSVSPLAQLPPLTTVPGTIGYYQIDPDGSFHSPLVPESTVENLQGRDQMPVDAAERLQRLALRTRLQTLLQAQQKVRQEAAVPPVSPAPVTKREMDRSAQDEVPASDKRTVTPTTGNDYAKAEQEPALDDRLYQEAKKLPDRLAAQNEGGTFSRGRVLSQQPRKEILNYLERKEAPPARPDSSVPAASTMAERATASAPGMSSTPGDKPAEASGTVVLPVYPALVKSMAGEIFPMEFELLPSGDFAFFRKVWRDRHMYVQGFVVDARTCLREIFSAALGGDPSTSPIAINVLYQTRNVPYLASERPQSAILLHRTSLATPMSRLELVLATASLPLGSGLTLLIAAGSLLGLLIPGVLYGVYRLGRAQIDLAQQRSNFVAAVSHELRTPLTSIRMYSEILRAGWTDSDTKKQSYYDFIFFESERLSRLIGNVLMLSRISSKDLSLALKPCTPAALLDRLHGPINAMADAAGFELIIESAPTGVSIQLEEDAFHQIMINLVDNAIKFSRNASPRKVLLGIRQQIAETARDPSHIAFYVRDFGPGINPARTERIFDLFTRGEDELTRSTPGTGIGLALVKELAHQLNARVCCEQRQPGVEFQVWFPASRDSHSTT